MDFAERWIRAGLALALGFLAWCCSPEPEPLGEAAERSRPAAGQSLFDAPAEEAGTGARLAPLVLPEDAPTVVFLGDSIGAGLHLAEHQAFPALLQRRLYEAGQPFHLVSSCESGRTTAGGVTALSWVLGREPALVVLQLGGNDLSLIHI